MNIGTDPCVNRDPSVWAKQRELYREVQMPVGPWMHCRSIDDVIRVIDIGVLWQADFIGVNIEDVVSDKLSLQEVSGHLLDYWVKPYGKPVHMPTLPWVQNGQGWQYVSYCYLALEMFPEEGDGQRYLTAYQDCIDHAFKEGAKRVTLLYSTKSPRSKYPNVAHCLYTADNVTSWPEWHDSETQIIPAPPQNGGSMTLSPTEKKAFRTQLRRYALVAQKYEHNWHYTQARPYTGLGTPASDTHYNDCSSYVALCFYKAGRNSGHPVADPLGYHYTGWGNTGSAYTYLNDHKAPEDKYRIGDVALYLQSGGPGDHMTVCIKEGTRTTSVWSSFGTEAGPDERSLNYRNDLTGVYRHPALL